LGERLGCGGHLSALRRLWVDPFTAPAMITMQELEAAAAAGPVPLDACLLPVEAGLAHLPSVRLDAEQGRVFAFGQPVPMGVDPGRYAVFSENGRLMAVGEVGVDAILRSQRGLNLPEPT
ncbi:MAG TPA: tRNA pseudouridine(55) synthase TruB, partial [Pinirhizobacter sp.]|uniref:tRNA pseudouridine(55) synthase TruB n=1 Tax=Pinirhizobacter sp. TaxID=2950432 RepID=UPI002BE8A55B